VAFSTSTITAGNRIIVGISIWGTGGAVITSVTDSAGNTYVKDSPACVLSDASEASIWSAPITAGVGTKPTVTAHASPNASKWAMYVSEYAVSVATTAFLDGTAVNNTAAVANPATSGASSPTPGSSGELAFGLFADTNAQTSITPSAGWTIRGTALADPTATTAEACIADQSTVAGTGSNASFAITTAGAAAGIICVVYKVASTTLAPLPPLFRPPLARMLAQPARQNALLQSWLQSPPRQFDSPAPPPPPAATIPLTSYGSN
jgi:hypothetical protein